MSFADYLSNGLGDLYEDFTDWLSGRGMSIDDIENQDEADECVMDWMDEHDDQ